MICNSVILSPYSLVLSSTIFSQIVSSDVNYSNVSPSNSFIESISSPLYDRTNSLPILLKNEYYDALSSDSFTTRVAWEKLLFSIGDFI